MDLIIYFFWLFPTADRSWWPWLTSPGGGATPAPPRRAARGCLLVSLGLDRRAPIGRLATVPTSFLRGASV